MDDNSPPRKRAFTLIELLVVIATLAVLAALLLPAVRGPSASPRINCVMNLMHIGQAFQIWSGDNNGRYPMQFYTNELGGMKFADATNLYNYFQVMSNELSSPKILNCPSDDRLPAANFTQLSKTNLSYFIGVDANEAHPEMFLSGDRNLTTNGVPVPAGMVAIMPTEKLGWTEKRHRGEGNVVLANGGAHMLTSSVLATAPSYTITNSGTNVMRLLIP